MLSFHSGLKIFLSVAACDMRKSFNGLYQLAEQAIGENPRDGALFVFCNRRRTRLKILYYDGTGLWVMGKRLEKGAFYWPSPSKSVDRKISLAPEALQLLLDGIDMKDGARRAWYERSD